MIISEDEKKKDKIQKLFLILMRKSIKLVEGNSLNLRNSYKKSTTLHLIVKFKMFPQNIKKEK